MKVKRTAVSLLDFAVASRAHLAQIFARMPRTLLPLSGILLIGLNGCSREKQTEDKYLYDTMHPIEIKRLDLPTDPLTAGLQQPLNYDPPKPPTPIITSLPVPSINPTENAAGAHYYEDFSDIYWKLNWMRKELLRGSVPYNMQDEIEKMFRKLQNLRHDGNYSAAFEALSRMQKGLEHLACLRTMHTAQINDLEVPWESGVETVQQYFDRFRSESDTQVTLNLPTHKHSIGDDEDDDGPIGHSLPPVTALAPNNAATNARNQAIKMVMDYVTRYHVSPRTMMQREWEAAIRKTNRLRNNLHLQNRPENNDGDGIDVLQAVTIGAGDYGTIHVPENAGMGSEAPAEVDYTQL